MLSSRHDAETQCKFPHSYFGCAERGCRKERPCRLERRQHRQHCLTTPLASNNQQDGGLDAAHHRPDVVHVAPVVCGVSCATSFIGMTVVHCVGLVFHGLLSLLCLPACNMGL